MDVVRRNGRRPHDPAVVVVLLDDRGDRPARADAVATHHDQPLLPVLVEVGRAERLGEELPELEDVTDLDRGMDDELAAALRAGIAFVRLPDVGKARLEVPSSFDSPKVPPVMVRA